MYAVFVYECQVPVASAIQQYTVVCTRPADLLAAPQITTKRDPRYRVFACYLVRTVLDLVRPAVKVSFCSILTYSRPVDSLWCCFDLVKLHDFE